MKKINFIVYISFAILLFSSLVYAQDPEDVQSEIENDILEILTGVSPISSPDLINTGNTNRVNQVGKENEAEIIQTRSFQNFGNLAVINQVGSYNKSKIVQVGNDNYSVSGQLGNYNESNLSLDGSHNLIGVFQLGDNNQFVQDFKGNNINFAILQQGSFNNYEQVNKTHQPNGLRIIQKGNGINTFILNGPGNSVISK